MGTRRSDFAIEIGPKNFSQTTRRSSSRLEECPESLSLEMIIELVDLISTILETQAQGLLPSASVKAICEYLNFVCAFVLDTRDRLVQCNLRLVGNAIQTQFFVRLKSKGVDLEDAMQEGSMGLLRAAYLYDASKGYAFSTYASWWIQCFLRKLVLSSNLIHIPPYLADPIHPKEKQKTSPGFFKNWENAQRAKNVRSMNVCFDDFGKKSYDLEIPDRNTDIIASWTDSRIDLADFMTGLDPLERRIIELRYLEGFTLDEVTEILFNEGSTPTRATRERTRQREQSALIYMKERAGVLPPVESKTPLAS